MPYYSQSLLSSDIMELMDELAKQYVLSFYDERLRMFGDRPEAVGWTPGGQILRYESLLEIGDMNGKRVLDFGCGKGDFYWYLKGRNIEVSYTGLDINERLIAVAKGKSQGVFFRVLDIEKEELGEEFDYILLCGVFNLKVHGIEETIRSTLRKLFDSCRIGLAFNALSAHDPEKDFQLHYVSPEDLLTFAVNNLSQFASVRQHRTAYDFTMFIYRKPNRCS